MGNYFKIGLPAVIMLLAEWWVFEIMTLLAGYISVAAVGTQVIVFNTYILLVLSLVGL